MTSTWGMSIATQTSFQNTSPSEAKSVAKMKLPSQVRPRTTITMIERFCVAQNCDLEATKSATSLKSLCKHEVDLR